MERCAPDVRRHPVIAENWDPRPRNAADGVNHVLDLLVTFRAAQHDVIVERRWHVLQRLQMQTVRLHLHAKFQQIGELPPLVAGNRAHLVVGLQHNITRAVLG